MTIKFGKCDVGSIILNQGHISYAYIFPFSLCKKDPFNHITLEIPQQPLRHILVVLIRDCVGTAPELPKKYIVSLPHTSEVKTLKERLSDLSGILPSRLNLCGVDFQDHKIRDVYE